jgi:hypothetical protein
VGTTTCEEVTRDRSVSVWGGSGLDGAREDLGLGVLRAGYLLVALLVVLLGILRAIFTLVVLLGGVLGVLGLVLGVLGLGVLLLLLLDGLLLLRATRV